MQHERGPEVSITPLVPWGIQIDKKVSLLGCAARLGNTLFVEVQPLTPPKSRSGKLATIFKLTHYLFFG